MSEGDAFIEAVADRVVAKLKAVEDHRPTGASSPWMTKDEAVTYTRIPEGTFRELMASGRIPSHGGRRRLFHRDEVDEALLGYSRGSNVTPIRKAS